MDTPQAGTLLAVMADQIGKLQAEVAELRAKK